MDPAPTTNTSFCDGCARAELDNYLFPFDAECEWHRAARIVFYLVVILWLFIGVGVASDKFSAQSAIHNAF